MPRQITHLEAEGAEFLVLGHLLIEGIQAYKAYTNAAGHDIIVVGPDSGRRATIQVKSRWRTGAEGFILKSLKSDFLLIVKLNRGTKDGKGKKELPQFYVLSRVEAEELPKAGWGKISFSKIHNLASYLDNWDSIRQYVVMAGPSPAMTT